MESVPKLTEDVVDALREELRTHFIRAERYQHTLRVEEEIVRLGNIYMPKDILRLRVVALLHDTAKELDEGQQLTYLHGEQVELTQDDLNAPAALHAISASVFVAKRYPHLVDEEMVRAILLHTTGDAHMSLMDKLLYIADYIEQGRKHESCLRVRERFWGRIADTDIDRNTLLNHALMDAFNCTILHLMRENQIISQKTIRARNDLLSNCGTKKKSSSEPTSYYDPRSFISYIKGQNKDSFRNK